MQVSVAWLRELVGPEIWLSATAGRNTPSSQIAADLAARLTMAGLEVESVTPAGPALPIGGSHIVRSQCSENLTRTLLVRSSSQANCRRKRRSFR